MKILLAGSESKESAARMQEVGAKNLLLSYYYLRKKKNPEPFLEEMRRNANFMFLDSGAHTFFHEAGISAVHGEKKSKTQENPDQYLHEYIQWLQEWGSFFDGYAELDIDQIVGHEKILEWHQIWKDSKLPNVVYCYHPSQPISYWEKICSENDYVGIQGNLPLQKYVGYLNTAKKYKTKVHGFAMTKLEPMIKLPFFSVDSTSWQSGERFGTTYEWNGRNLLCHLKDDKVKIRRKLKAKVLKTGIVDPDALIADDRRAVGQWNILQWLEFEKYIDSHSKKYWEETPVTASIDKKGDVTVLPKESGVLPKEPRKSNLPESTKGKIMELRNDPTIEARRKIAQAAAMKGNLFGFKNGKYVNVNAFMSCANCYVAERCPAYQEPTEENPRPLCAFSDIFNDTFKAADFDVRNMDTMIDSYNKIVTSLLQRLARANFFEQLDGGMVDKSLVPLYGILAEFMKITGKENNQPAGHYTQNNYYVAAEQLKQLDPAGRKKVSDAIRTALGANEGGVRKNPLSGRVS